MGYFDGPFFPRVYIRDTVSPIGAPSSGLLLGRDLASCFLTSAVALEGDNGRLLGSLTSYVDGWFGLRYLTRWAGWGPME